MKKYIIKLLLLLAILLPLQLSAQLPNQIELRKFTTSGMVSFWITPENSKALGFDGSGNPAMLAVGGSSTLAGLSDVGLTSVADLNLLQYDAATSKWKNISGATYALASHTQDWSTITSTPTTLAGYNIVNPDIGAATATSINGAGIFSSLGVIGVGASSTAANRVAGMSGNIAIGASALGAAALTTFDENTAIGKNAMAMMTSTITGGNTALGSQSMEAMTGGTQNTAIGYESMGQTTANISGVIAIGSSAGRHATANNELFINSQLKSSYANDQTQSIIYGGMASSAASQFLHFNVGYLQLGNSSTASELRLMEPSGSGTNYTGFKSPALAGDVVYTLPAADGTSGQALTTNGSGALSFSSVAGLGANTFTGAQTINAATTPLTVQSGGINAATITTTATAGSLWVGHPDYFSFDFAGGAIVGKYAGSERSRINLTENAYNVQIMAGSTGNNGLYVTNSNLSAAYIGGDIRLNTTVGVFTVEPLKRDAIGAYTGPGHTVRVKGGDGQSASAGAAGGDAEIRGGEAGGSGNNNGGAVKLIGGSATGSGATGSPMQLTEQDAPPLPPANGANVWVEDNGSGKTRLMVQFATGAAQEIEIEP